MYEVEQKFPLDDFSDLEAKLILLGAEIDEPVEQVDTYYAHPARDFARTDEALRIRRVGQAAWLTYKGPKLDAEAKTRREIELPLGGAADAGQLGQLVEALGFVPVAEVRKTRRPWGLNWEGRLVAGALDSVKGLGTFAELEIVAAPDDVEAAQAVLASLAAELGLKGSERRSYLELLLER